MQQAWRTVEGTKADEDLHDRMPVGLGDFLAVEVDEMGEIG